MVIANDIMYTCGYSSGDVDILDPDSLETIDILDAEYSRCSQLAVANGYLFVVGPNGVSIYERSR